MNAHAPPAPCPTKRALLHALYYFEVFRYPLTLEELYAFANCAATPLEEIENMVRELVREGQAFQFGRYFQATDDPDWLPRRLEYNQRAESFFPVAQRMARFIGGFPFIRAVFISGSLSKHCMPPDGDIDYFLITVPGRLWLARTILVVFKKLFLFNSHKYFCVNYFIDTEHLEIEDKNLFTATETATLLPMYGREWYADFMAGNRWTQTFLPHFPLRATGRVPQYQRGVLKKALETLLSGRFGAWLDARAMHLTVGYWRRKFRHFDEQTFDNALKSRRYVSKHHPLYFQQKVMRAYQERVDGV